MVLPRRKEYKEELVSIKNPSGELLVGDVTFPDIPQAKHAVIILVHGFGAERHESGLFTDLANMFSSSGLLVFRFDFSGCGDSEGDYSETSLTKLGSDLKAILNFVRKRHDVDQDKIGVLAQSFGTSTIVSIEPTVACLVLTGAISNPHKVMKEIFREGYNPKGVSSRVRSGGNITKVGPQFWTDFSKHNLLGSITKIKCPVLFIHGSKDDKVPLSQMMAFYKKANSPKKKVVLEGADHSLRPHRQKVYQIVLNWFNNYLVVEAF